MNYKVALIELIDEYEKANKLNNVVWEYVYRFMRAKLKGGS